MVTENTVSRIKRKVELRKWYENLMKNKFCSRCGCKNFRALIWTNEVERLVYRIYSKESIIKEMEQGQVICWNCKKTEEYPEQLTCKDEYKQRMKERRKKNGLKFREPKLKPKKEKEWLKKL